MATTTLQMITTVVVFLIAGCVGLMVSLQCARYFMKGPVSVGKIFYGLRPKLWMTAGVGCFFLIFYCFTLFVGTNLINSDNPENMETRLKIFNLMRSNPILFIYLGLTVFVLISISILGVRSIIKRIYNSRNS